MEIHTLEFITSSYYVKRGTIESKSVEDVYRVSNKFLSHSKRAPKFNLTKIYILI